MEKKFCLYYQASINIKYTWFIGGVFKSEDNVVFVRALEEDSNIQEFFVPEEMEERFLNTIDCLVSMGYVFSYQKLTNRLA